MKKDFTTYTQKQILICRSTSRISHAGRFFLYKPISLRRFCWGLIGLYKKKAISEYYTIKTAY